MVSDETKIFLISGSNDASYGSDPSQILSSSGTGVGSSPLSRSRSRSRIDSDTSDSSPQSDQSSSSATTNSNSRDISNHNKYLHHYTGTLTLIKLLALRSYR